MTKRRALMLVETMGSIAWFAMDASWMTNARVLSAVLAVPTVILNVLAVQFTPRRWSSVLVASAMGAWACMNTFWMAHDLGFVEGTWPLVGAKVFLVAGAVLIALSMLFDRRESVHELLSRFRRLRLRG